ncbi:MAG: polymer-forming cytoskeletal protein [Deltaproteobacteria bacterium]|jgi:cytoskeletal protein CcmA (bactofilin family)|nr:polymer-forming cytoskeletal protein [Deltaproteobacteria bacterium]
MPLFGKKKKDEKSQRIQTAVSQNETSYFGKNLMIKGRISGNGNVIILGGLEGEFNLRGRVKIAEPAKIKGEVKADFISVNGSVKGTLSAQQQLHLEKTARIEGQIITPKLSIDEGATFNGEITMGGNITKPSEAAADEAAAVPQKPDASKSDSL